MLVLVRSMLVLPCVMLVLPLVMLILFGTVLVLVYIMFVPSSIVRNPEFSPFKFNPYITLFAALTLWRRDGTVRAIFELY